MKRADFSEEELALCAMVKEAYSGPTYPRYLDEKLEDILASVRPEPVSAPPVLPRRGPSRRALIGGGLAACGVLAWGLREKFRPRSDQPTRDHGLQAGMALPAAIDLSAFKLGIRPVLEPTDQALKPYRPWVQNFLRAAQELGGDGELGEQFADISFYRGSRDQLLWKEASNTNNEKHPFANGRFLQKPDLMTRAGMMVFYNEEEGLIWISRDSDMECVVMQVGSRLILSFRTDHPRTWEILRDQLLLPHADPDFSGFKPEQIMWTPFKIPYGFLLPIRCVATTFGVDPKEEVLYTAGVRWPANSGKPRDSYQKVPKVDVLLPANYTAPRRGEMQSWVYPPSQLLARLAAFRKQ